MKLGTLAPSTLVSSEGNHEPPSPDLEPFTMNSHAHESLPNSPQDVTTILNQESSHINYNNLYYCSSLIFATKLLGYHNGRFWF